MENRLSDVARLPAHYLDRWTVSPGERVGVMASGDGPAEATLVRLRGLSGGPLPQGYLEEPVGPPQTLTLTPQPVRSGSRAQTPHGPGAAPGAPWRWMLRLLLTLVDRGEVMAWGEDGPRVALVEGRLQAAWAGARLAVPLSAHGWWEMVLTADGAGRLILEVRPVGAGAWHRRAATAACPAPRAAIAGPLVFGKGFSGKIENPSLDIDGELAAAWDFAADMARQRVPGRGPQGRELALVNAPRRGVTSSAWTGEAHDWTQRPDHYGAIHFHDDDLADCEWPTAAELSVPHDAASGVYAVRLETALGVRHAPLFVRTRQPAPVVFLASTFSYLAYGHSVWEPPGADAPEKLRAQTAQAQRLGLSMYNRHRDGSGIGLVSSRRPILNATPGFMGEAIGGQVVFNDDLRIVAWLEAAGHAYDVVTDHDLHERGAEALAGHRVLVTGSHPEYHSAASLDACERFADAGGRILYMGGNGFYWRVDTLADAPHVMELRRAEGGIRIWPEPPGEYHHQSDGKLGGLWRRLGRPPNRLVGVGFSAQGSEAESRPFVRTTAAADPRAAFLFEGVEAGEIGAPGPLGAAAGYELDRADPALGTPPHALVVARSTPFGPRTFPVNEERLTHLQLDAVDPLRADITFHERAGGGAVLAFSSILFAGTLQAKGLARCLADNALGRFVQESAFHLPKS